MLEWSHTIALGLGIAGSIVIHISQGMMKLGIWLRQQGNETVRSRWIYRIGVTLNFTAPLWIVVANRFGPTALYTSMYAVGLLPLLVFSATKLNYRPARSEIAGSILIVLASPLLASGVAKLGLATASPKDVWAFLWVGLLLLTLLSLGLHLAKKLRWPPEGLLFGGVGGGYLALDSLLKGIAQANEGVVGFLPKTPEGWGLFILSFLGAGIAFGMTQWAHFRGAAPSQTIASYDAGYVLLPILLLPFLYQNAQLNWFCLLGIAITLSGLVLLSFSKSH